MQALLLRGDPLAPTHDVGERDEGNRQAGRTPGGGTLQTTMLAFLLIQDGPRETENQLYSTTLISFSAIDGSIQWHLSQPRVSPPGGASLPQPRDQDDHISAQKKPSPYPLFHFYSPIFHYMNARQSIDPARVSRSPLHHESFHHHHLYYSLPVSGLRQQ